MTQSLQNKIEEAIEHFNRDFFITKEKTYSTQTKSISEWLRDELSSIATLAQEEKEKEIYEFVADERDKADAHYKDEQDDYSQGYFMAMNTVMKKIYPLSNNTLQ